MLRGDCLAVLADMEPESVHAIVTDPPYEIGFMGRAWDATGIAYDPATWAACLRVLKPGGHLLSFGATRTYHGIASAVERAGFEVRDCLSWLYGSGFPKSLDVSKAIDQAGGISPAMQAATLRMARKRARMSRNDVARAVGCTAASVRDWEEGRARRAGLPVEWVTPSDQYRAALADLLGYTADDRRVVGLTTDRREDGSVLGLGHSGREYGAPVTDEAERWQGWGTALKPAWEPILLARKPLVGTVAANVLRHGTGALNVDGCRVGTGGQLKWSEPRDMGYHGGTDSDADATANALGRWPANVTLDAEAAAMLDEQTGELGLSIGGSRGAGGQHGRLSPIAAQLDFESGYGDTGGASRFFYVAKPSSAERNAGLDGFEEYRVTTLNAGVDGSLPRNRPNLPRANVHPTVKPIELMRWLCRLVTPPGGTILDPFTGSGTTGCAAILEGFDFLGCEMSEEYADIAEARIAWWAKHAGEGTVHELLDAGRERDATAEIGQASIFDLTAD